MHAWIYVYNQGLIDPKALDATIVSSVLKKRIVSYNLFFIIGLTNKQMK